MVWTNIPLNLYVGSVFCIALSNCLSLLSNQIDKQLSLKKYNQFEQFEISLIVLNHTFIHHGREELNVLKQGSIVFIYPQDLAQNQNEINGNASSIQKVLTRLGTVTVYRKQHYMLPFYLCLWLFLSFFGGNLERQFIVTYDFSFPLFFQNTIHIAIQEHSETTKYAQSFNNKTDN